MAPVWKTAHFDEFLVLQRGQDLTKSQFQPGDVPVAGSNGVIGYHNEANVASPGVTVGRSGSVGKVSIYRRPFWAHNTCLYVRDFRGNDEVFSYYFLQYLDVGRFKSGASVPTLDRNTFRFMPVIFPSLAEQRQIALVLSAVQRAIEWQERLIALTAELKKALMHHLFTHGTRGEPLKQTEIGPMPESWNPSVLRDQCTLIVDCPHTTPKFSKCGVRVVRNYNIRDGEFLAEPAFFTTCADYTERVKRAVPKPGDVLFSREAPVGEACVIPGGVKTSLGQRLMLIRTDPKKLDPRFLVATFYSSGTRTRMMSTASGLTTPHLNVADVRDLLIAIPKMNDQKIIADVFERAHWRLSRLRAIEASYRDLFHTLLQQLMTAQVRVHDLDLSTLDELAAEPAGVM